MLISSASSFLLFLLSSLVHGTHNLDYSDLEILGMACPQRDKCQGYRNNLTYIERSCECDSACQTYNDCCIDALRRRQSSRLISGSSWTCLPYGNMRNAGVYVIATCSDTWNGSSEIQEKCEGLDDLSDPLVAAPVTSTIQALTYRNRYCAECNNAEVSSLTTFQLRVDCEGLQDLLPAEQMFSDMIYDGNLSYWGIDRLNYFGNETNFIPCDIIFDVPDYLNNSVRFCRSEIVSSCPQTYTRRAVRKACSDYMAVVFKGIVAYRNPHCAICNGETIDQLSCEAIETDNSTFLSGRKRPMSFALLLDINPSDGDQVGMTTVTTPECPSSQKYDPFFKKCRPLVCAIPGYVMVNGKCVKR